MLAAPPWLSKSKGSIIHQARVKLIYKRSGQCRELMRPASAIVSCADRASHRGSRMTGWSMCGGGEKLAEAPRLRNWPIRAARCAEAVLGADGGCAAQLGRARRIGHGAARQRMAFDYSRSRRRHLTRIVAELRRMCATQTTRPPSEQTSMHRCNRQPVHP
jgi:hypothetical protein